MKIIKPTPKPVPTRDDRWKVKQEGTLRDGDLRIFITKTVLHEITTYSSSDLTREVGGVLVGGYYDDDGSPYVEIDAYIPAKLGESKSASFKFTHEAWHEISLIKEEKYPDRILVGWHHTHPQFGLFLSSMDMFIHQGYFNLPWQVAMVVDPVADGRRGTLAFFQWRGSQVVDCGFYLMTRAQEVVR